MIDTKATQIETPQGLAERITEGLHQVEGVLVSVSIAAAPLGGLLPAAWMSLDHMERVLMIPLYVAYPIAVALEALGYAAVTVAVEMIQRRRWMLIAISTLAFGLYLLDIVALNIVLSVAEIVFPGTNWLLYAKVLACACLALMSVPAALLFAVRSMQRGIVAKEAEAAEQHSADVADAYAHDERMKQIELDSKAKEREIKRAERAEKQLKATQNNPAQVAQPAQPTPAKLHKSIDLVVLADTIKNNQSATNAQLGVLLGGFSAEAVRKAKIRLHSNQPAATSAAQATTTP